MAKQKLAPGANDRPMDALRPPALDSYMSDRLRSLLGTCRFLLLEGPGTVQFGCWMDEQEEPLKTAASDFINAVTVAAVSGQDVLDATPERKYEGTHE